MSVHVVVIGAGPGGYNAAIRAAQLGAKVTLIEKDKPGGVCLNWGCIPTKTLLSGADLLRKTRQSEKYGLDIDGPVKADMKAMIRRKQKVVQDQIKGLGQLFEHHKIHYIQGQARITGPKSLVVQGPESSGQDIQWDRLIIATGSVTKGLDGFPFDGQKILSSDHALELETVPDSLLIVGGGVVGCEFASLFSALGSQIVLVEAMERLLPISGIDKDSSSILLREMKKQKVKCLLKTVVSSWQDQGLSLRVLLTPWPVTKDQGDQATSSESIQAEKILLCLGRNPETSSLGLENIGLQTDDNGWLRADKSLATEVEGVYAIGDILGPSRMMLAHSAAFEGRLAAENALNGPRQMEYGNIPNAIFTSPEVASTGLAEEQAVDLGYNVDTEKVLFRSLGKAHAEGDIAGQGKIVFDKSTGKLLGAHLIGAHVTEYISEMVLAINQGCTIKDIAETIHPHPTFSEILGEVSLNSVHRLASR